MIFQKVAKDFGNQIFSHLLIYINVLTNNHFRQYLHIDENLREIILISFNSTEKFRKRTQFFSFFCFIWYYIGLMVIVKLLVTLQNRVFKHYCEAIRTSNIPSVPVSSYFITIGYKLKNGYIPALLTENIYLKMTTYRNNILLNIFLLCMVWAERSFLSLLLRVKLNGCSYTSLS